MFPQVGASKESVCESSLNSSERVLDIAPGITVAFAAEMDEFRGISGVIGASGLRGGASVLPNGAGAWARLLSPESPEATETLHTLWDTVRRALIGVPAPDRRKP